MQENTSKKSNLGKYVFLALIAGLIIGQLIRMVVTDSGTLASITEHLNMLAGLFLRLIKMIIAPLVFSTLVVGIAKLSDAKALGRMFFKAMFIFIIGGIISLLVGLAIVEFFAPGKSLGHTLMATHSSLVADT
ncbi:MAG: cation:dicarboxylate symporter family transporter, partial [Burkholderiales bacterium]